VSFVKIGEVKDMLYLWLEMKSWLDFVVFF